MSLIISEAVPVDSDRVTGYLVPVGTTVTAVTVYASPHSVDAIIEEVERQARQAATGLTADTRAGRAELASLAHRVVRTKTALDDLGKDLVAEWKAKSAAVDAQRRRIREALDGLKGAVRAPLTQWELDEEAREVRIAHVLGRLRALAMPSTAPSEAIAAKLADAVTMGLDGLDERHHEGVALRAEIVDQLQRAYAVAVKRERLEAERQAADDAARAERERADELARRLEAAEAAIRSSQEAQRQAADARVAPATVEAQAAPHAVPAAEPVAVDPPAAPPAGAPLMTDDELAQLIGLGPFVGPMSWLIVKALAEIKYWRARHDQRGR
jgi:hypothetical protein